MAYKIIKGHVILDHEMMPKYEYQHLSRKCNETKVGQQNQLAEPPYTIEVAQKTFFFSTPKLWNNNVSALQANAPSVEAFKQHFKKKQHLYIYWPHSSLYVSDLLYILLPRLFKIGAMYFSNTLPIKVMT